MKNSIGVVKTEYVNFSDDFYLESGRILSDITVAYEKYGEMNADKDNVILICHALTGSAHAAGVHKPDEQKPGWWEQMIGPGKAFDTDKFCIICTNFLGSCFGTTGPASIDKSTNKPYGLKFPVITVKDMVKLQKKFIDYFKIDKLFCVAGGSMGGMQALEWAVTFPEKVKSIIPVATAGRITPMAIAFNTIGRFAIMKDPNWNDGDYYGKSFPKDGLAIARMAGHITFMSDKSFQKKFARRYFPLIVWLFIVVFFWNVWGLVIDWLGASVNHNILEYLRPMHSDLNTTVAMAAMVVVTFLAVWYKTHWTVWYSKSYLFNWKWNNVWEKCINVFVGWLHFIW